MTPPAVRPRLESIDLVRGLIMVLMTLDHTRDFFHGSAGNPRDVADPALFVTRWITHFCAPTFVFLAGVSAYLYGQRGRSRGELSRFLLTRGLWLVVLELSIVRFGWTFSLLPQLLFLQVIWVIGWSMVVLAGLSYLPRWAIAAFALALIGGHNLLDGVRAAELGDAGWLWHFLHERTTLRPSESVAIVISYPLLPWIGVLAAGYAFAPVFTRPRAARNRWLVATGLAAMALFVVLRGSHLYGDPTPRAEHAGALAAALEFVNCEKYPPSLLYLCMTLGPALIALALAERARGRAAAWLITLGRVPMLYYVVHLLLLHLAAVLYALIADVEMGWLFGKLPSRNKPAGYGTPLSVVVAIWIAVLVALTPLCRWFAALKQRRNDWWLSYL